MVDIRIGFIGDSITHGTGDATLLGWTIRVAQAEATRGHDVVVYNLGVRADTSELVAARWRAECDARLKPPFNCATVFAVGINDSAHENSATPDGRRVALEQSLDVVSDMLIQARDFGPVLWVGPTPVIESMMPITRIPGVSYDFSNATIDEYNQAYTLKAADLGVPYLDLFAPLDADPRWTASLRNTDGLHPDAAGYELMAALICDWNGWRALFDG
jgi:lysophospholipase L1-like esterase